MNCPKCHARLTVAHTDDRGNEVVRVRTCPNCRYICRTRENFPGEKKKGGAGEKGPAAV
ncbi:MULTISPECIES: hypothetical protein [unclassified Pyramidobacter]|uniref:hypothetical protein n=1 Tax=unclassified Pyramidobacter TaxID=2632171 RepID=UPI001315374A|nr:hypothetical protein [Pyramidobacter sp. CG50-2]